MQPRPKPTNPDRSGKVGHGRARSGMVGHGRDGRVQFFVGCGRAMSGMVGHGRAQSGKVDKLSGKVGHGRAWQAQLGSSTILQLCFSL